MKHVYACLTGKWVDITSEGKINQKDPVTFYKEEIQNLFEYDYVNITYDHKNYRIHPSFIQIVTT